jgi:hypothetical protein
LVRPTVWRIRSTGRRTRARTEAGDDQGEITRGPIAPEQRSDDRAGLTRASRLRGRSGRLTTSVARIRTVAGLGCSLMMPSSIRVAPVRTRAKQDGTGAIRSPDWAARSSDTPDPPVLLQHDCLTATYASQAANGAPPVRLSRGRSLPVSREPSGLARAAGGVLPDVRGNTARGVRRGPCPCLIAKGDGLELAGERERTMRRRRALQRVQRVRHSGASVGHRGEHLADITWDAHVRATAGAECRKRIP